jgi:hypothetical protein
MKHIGFYGQRTHKRLINDLLKDWFIDVIRKAAEGDAKTDSLHFEQRIVLDWRFLNFLKDKVIKRIAYFKKDIGAPLAENAGIGHFTILSGAGSPILQICKFRRFIILHFLYKQLKSSKLKFV